MSAKRRSRIPTTKRSEPRPVTKKVTKQRVGCYLDVPNVPRFVVKRLAGDAHAALATVGRDDERRFKAQEASDHAKIMLRECFGFAQWGVDSWSRELDKASKSGIRVMPRASVWLSPLTAQALRRTARAASHVADTEGFFDEQMASMPRALAYIDRLRRLGEPSAVKVAALARGVVARGKVRRWLIGRFEKRTTKTGKILYYDLEEEKRQLNGQSSSSSLKRTRVPKLLTAEKMGSPRTMRRRLVAEVESRGLALQKELQTRERKLREALAATKALETAAGLSRVLSAIEAGYRYLGAKMSDPIFSLPTKEAEVEAEDPEGRGKQQKRAEYKVIFNRYDEDQGGTVDADELGALLSDLGYKGQDTQETINTLIKEFSKGSTEVTFEELCSMLDSLEERAKKKAKDAARDALKHRCLLTLAPPCRPPLDVARARARISVDLKLVAPPKEEVTVEEPKKKLRPPWKARVENCFFEDEDEQSRSSETVSTASTRSRPAPRVRGRKRNDPEEDAREAAKLNAELRLFVEEEHRALEWHDSREALKMLLTSRTTRVALEDALSLESTWPLKNVFPLPLSLIKSVEVFGPQKRFSCVLDGKGQLVAMSHFDDRVCYGPGDKDSLAELADGAFDCFEEARPAFQNIIRSFDRQTERFLAAVREHEEVEVEVEDDDDLGRIFGDRDKMAVSELVGALRGPLRAAVEELKGPLVRLKEATAILGDLEERDLAMLASVFESFDVEDEGSIPLASLPAACVSAGLAVTPTRLAQLVKSDRLDFDRFRSIIGKLRRSSVKLSTEERQFEEREEDQGQLKLFLATEAGGSVSEARARSVCAALFKDETEGDVAIAAAELGVDAPSTVAELPRLVGLLLEAPLLAQEMRGRGVRRHLDARMEDLGFDLPGAPDGLVIDAYVDTVEEQRTRGRALPDGFSLRNTANLKVYVNAVTPLYLDQEAPLALGLFDRGEKDALQGIRARRAKSKKQRGTAARHRAGEESDESDNEFNDYGWRPPAEGVVQYLKKTGRRRRFEFRYRERNDTSDQTRAALDMPPEHDTGRIILQR